MGRQCFRLGKTEHEGNPKPVTEQTREKRCRTLTQLGVVALGHCPNRMDVNMHLKFKGGLSLKSSGTKSKVAGQEHRAHCVQLAGHWALPPPPRAAAAASAASPACLGVTITPHLHSHTQRSCCCCCLVEINRFSPADRPPRV